MSLKITISMISAIYFCFFSLLLIKVNSATMEQNAISINMTVQTVFNKVDIQNRRQFWFYLRGADIVFNSTTQGKDKYTCFVIYSNRVGVFLVIATYDTPTGKTRVGTMIRLGQMVTSNIYNSQKNLVDLNPIIIEIRVGQKNYGVIIDESGAINIDTDLFQFKTAAESSKVQTIRLLDIYLKHRYWYYLQGSKITMTETINNGDKNYTLFLYQHSSGIYLAIGALNPVFQLQVNTFVRLGGLFKSQDNKEGVISDINPRIFQLN